MTYDLEDDEEDDIAPATPVDTGEEDDDMSGAGLVTTSRSAPAPGSRMADYYARERAAGKTWEDINTNVARFREAAAAKGIPDTQIDAYLGYKADSKVDARITDAVKRDIAQQGPLKPTTNWYEAAQEGMARSSIGRLLDPFLPEFKDGTAGHKIEGTGNRIISGTSEAIGDIPAAIGGAISGAAGGPIIMGAGAFALPSFIKSIYAEGFDKGEIKGPLDFAERYVNVLWDTTSAGATGALTFATGGVVSAWSKAKALLPMTSFGLRATSDIATITAVNSALHQQLPTLEEVTDLAGITLLLHGFNKGSEVTTSAVSEVKRNLLRLWSSDPQGRSVKAIAEAAKSDPDLQAKLVAGVPTPPPAGSSKNGTAHSGDYMVPRLRGDFDAAVEWVLNKEGGETTDTGGLTRFGISQKAHPEVDVAYLDERMARQIYHDKYWKAVDADNLPPEARLPVFDAAVNEGVGKAKEMWAESGGDVPTFLKLRAEHYAQLAKSDKYAPYFDGWMNRLRDQGYDGPMTEQGIALRGSEPPKEPPKPPEPPEPGTPEGDRAHLASRIGDPKQALSTWEKIKTGAEELYTQFFHRNHPIWKLINATRTGEAIPEAKNPKFIMQLADAAKESHAKYMIEDGMVGKDGMPTGAPSLKSIMAEGDTLPGGLVEAELYARSRQAQQDRAQGKETGIDPEVADRFVAANAHFEPWLQKVTAWRDQTLDYLVEGGVITREAADASKAENPLGIPKYRVMDEGKSNTGPGGYQASNPIREARGSERKYRPLFEVLMEDAFRRVRDAQNNEVSRSISNLALEAGLAEKTSSTSRKYDLTLAEKEKLGVEEDADASIWRRAGMERRSDEVGYFEDGKFVTVKFADPEVTKILKGMDYVQRSQARKMLVSVTNVVKKLVTINPAFGPSVAALDVLQQFVTRPGWNNTIAEVVEGLVHPMTNSKLYNEWKHSPAGQNVFEPVARDPYIRDQLAGKGDPSFGRTLWNYTGYQGYRALQAWSNLWMNAIEIGSYARARKAGDSVALASAKSAEASFMGGIKVGRFAAEMNAVQMFFSSWVALMEQSAKSLTGQGRTMLTEKQFKASETWTKGALAITLPALSLWWLNKDKDWWKEKEGQIKRGFFPIRIGGDGPEGSTFMFPIGQPFGLIFADAPIRMAQSLHEHDPHAWDDFGRDVMSATIPTGGVFGTGILTPTIEVIANHSFLTDDPIVNDKAARYLPEYRDTAYTTETAKALGQMLNVSPPILEHLIRGYTGSLGWNVVKSAENFIQSVDPDFKPLAPALRVADWPLFGSFLARNRGAGADQIQRYFDQIDQYDATYNTLLKLMKENRYDEFKKVLDDDPVSGVLHAYQIRGANAEIIANNPDADKYMALLQDKFSRIPKDKAQAFLDMKNGIKQSFEMVRLIGGLPTSKTDESYKDSMGRRFITPSDRRQLLDRAYLKIQRDAEQASTLMDELGFK